MPTQIELLAALQQVDQTLYENTKTVEAGRSLVADLEATLAARQQDLDSTQGTLDDIETRQRDLEGLLEDIEVKLKDRRMRVARIRNERELAVVRHEIDTLKEETSNHETELLTLLEQVDSARALRDAALAARDALTVERDEAVAALDATIARVKDAMERDETRRGELAGQVDDDLHRRYRMIFERRDGVAVVGVSNGTCQGCHMNLPPQLYNQVLRNEQVLLCPSCQRIVVSLPESTASEA